MSVKAKIQAIFAKAQDEAMKAADEEPKETPPPKKEEKTSDGYDAVMQAVKDQGEKVSGFMEAAKKGKDASTEPTESAPAKVVAKDEEVAPSLEDRLNKLEAAVAKLLEMQAKTGDDDGEGDIVTDEDGDDDEAESEDDDFEESTMTGDTASRVEILAPGTSAKGKDAKARALKAAYATTDGKSVIDHFTGGKAPDLKNEVFVNSLFIGASELLKSKRSGDFARTKVRDFLSSTETPKGAMTAEKMNELNAKHYGTSH